MVVEGVLRQGHAHQQVERLDRRNMVPEPQEDVVGLVGLAATAGLQEGLLRRLDAFRGDGLAAAVIGKIGRPARIGAGRIERGEVQQAERRGDRVVDVLVGQSDVLEDGQELVLTVQPVHQVGDRVQPGERVQRTAVMAGRQVGGPHHRQRRGGQHGLRLDTGTQFLQRAVQDLGGRRLLDELDQRFYCFGILDACVHYGLLVSCVCA